MPERSIRTLPLPLQRFTRRDFLKAGSIAGLGAVLASCRGGGSPPSQTKATTSAKPPATKPEKLIVRTWSGPFEKALELGPARTFSEETGIQVAYNRTFENVTFTQTQAAVRAGRRPPIDVEWSTPIFGILEGVQGLLTPLNPEIVTNVAQVNKTPGQPPNGSWDWVGAYAYTVPIVYRTDKIQQGSFSTWENLWSPDYEGAIGFCSVIICTLPTVAKLVGVDIETADMTPVWNKYRALKPNIGALGGADIQPLIAGEQDILIDLVSYGVQGRDEGHPIGWEVPQEGATMDRDTFWVVGNLPEDVAYYAQVFVNHVLDRNNQEIISDTLGVIPISTEAQLPAYMQEDPAAFPFTQEDIDQYAIIGNTEVMAKHHDEWQASFDQALKG
jgi:spermidine/putrescine-binding protein